MKKLLSKFSIFALIISLGVIVASCSQGSDKQKVLDILDKAREEVQKAKTPEEVATISEKYNKELDQYSSAIEKMQQEDQEEIMVKAFELMSIALQKAGVSLEDLDLEDYAID